jgi:DNA repair protein RecO (recombination protein O)
MRVSSQLAYILHKRAFRESSQILEVFTRDHGRVCLMSRGSRSQKSRSSGVLQAYRPLLLGWQGRGDMPTLCEIDSAAIKPPPLVGKALLSAVYLNELLMHLLHRHDVHQNLFGHYHDTLYALAENPAMEVVLRRFEKNLLDDIGFGLNLSHDADSGDVIDASAVYLYHLEHGPVRRVSAQGVGSTPSITGAALIAFERDQVLPAHAAEIKALMRYVLQHHLGDRQLKSRELFRAPLRPAE